MTNSNIIPKINYFIYNTSNIKYCKIMWDNYFVNYELHIHFTKENSTKMSLQKLWQTKDKPSIKAFVSPTISNKYKY